MPGQATFEHLTCHILLLYGTYLNISLCYLIKMYSDFSKETIYKQNATLLCHFHALI